MEETVVVVVGWNQETATAALAGVVALLALLPLRGELRSARRRQLPSWRFAAVYAAMTGFVGMACLIIIWFVLVLQP